MISDGAKKRAAAATEYDEMQRSGMPEYEIFIRTQMNPQWLPVGAIAVRRSDQVNQAVYANEEALLQGAFHRLPVLKKHRATLTFEYGYRLKEFKDEPIVVAVKPAAISPNPIQSAFASLTTTVGAKLGSLFPPQAK
jgi:Family of unknown function (DUF6523)